MSTWDFSEQGRWLGRPVALCFADAEARRRLRSTATVRSAAPAPLGGGWAYLCHLEDGSGSMRVAFVGRRSVPGVAAGARIRLEGTVRADSQGLVVWNPLYRIEAPAPGPGSPPVAPARQVPPTGTAEIADAPGLPDPPATPRLPAALRSVAGQEVAEEVESAGHFRIYLGAVAGVGKTCAMLEEGRRRRDRGTDVVVGFAETHGRAHTAALLEGLEVVPRRTVTYRGSGFEEMDLDAVLARRPAVVLVDELAHTNVPGSGRHAKRWEDVVDILAAGIDVVSTVNVQHLESIADAVEAITGVAVRERVPDWVVRRADQIELVDSSPQALRRRMLHGNIYPPDKVPDALAHFFRAENLTALRELALRFLADETEDDLLDYLRRHPGVGVWETTERIMVAVTAAPGSDAVLRRAARLARRVRGELDAVHVAPGDAAIGEDRALEGLRRLAGDLGAHWHDVVGDDPVGAIIALARAQQTTQLVVGSSRRARRRVRLGGDLSRRILAEAAEAGLDVHVIARREPDPAGSERAR